MLVVAGAGTGKTTVLASRVVRLIEDGLAEPREILAVTYTRNSARDLLKRIARLWKGSDDPATVSQVVDSGLKVGTFHAYCYLLLRNAGQRFDLIDDTGPLRAVAAADRRSEVAVLREGRHTGGVSRGSYQVLQALP